MARITPEKVNNNNILTTRNSFSLITCCNMYCLQGHVVKILLVFAFSGVILAMVELLGVVLAVQQALTTLIS